jgi:beta-lactam-binding protein with PASTA domain
MFALFAQEVSFVSAKRSHGSKVPTPAEKKENCAKNKVFKAGNEPKSNQSATNEKIGKVKTTKS